jgi:dipeptidyl aminopeptidase/acylaminoacyl peptidase
MRQRCRYLFTLVILLGAAGAINAQAKGRAIEPEDYYRFAEVRDARVSPDGAWVVYVVGSNDRASDEPRTTLWMVSWDGRQQVQLTAGLKDADAPRFSPDGASIAFLATPPGGDKAQILLMDRRGGEPRAITHVTGEISQFEWSPDGKRMVLVEQGDPPAVATATDAAAAKAPRPIVIDALHFKQDISGYVEAGSWQRVKVLDIASQNLQLLTADKDAVEDAPAWSPDGRTIAYVRTHGVGSDVDGKQDLMRVDAQPGATPQVLARIYAPNAQSLEWSPDGKSLAHFEGQELKLYAYLANRLFVLPVGGGEARPVAPKLDRGVAKYTWAADGRSFFVIIEDDQSSYPARLDAASGNVERLVAGQLSTLALAQGGKHVALVTASDRAGPEVASLDGHALRKLTSHNAALLAEIDLGAVEDLSFDSTDGVTVHGLMIKPPGFVEGRRYPTIVWIHGGPNGQDEHSLLLDRYPLQFERQFLASLGYVVLAINYRGSSGRGSQFQQSIAADWCHHEVEDLRAGVDHVIKRGIADPERLGIGGWSYGGILTDCTIARDQRFRAAVSGAGSANQLSMFGHDQYVLQYVNEIGAPWNNPDLWLKVSYAFFHADRIKTPTLFLGGQNDFNVPIAGGEQMYQALRVQGVPSQLVVYPDQFHIFTRPSYIVDRARRVREWYATYLK